MPTYIINNGELCHYGVPGMKWGVRRAIGQKAKKYARAERLHKPNVKVVERLKNKKKKYGSLSERDKKRLRAGEEYLARSNNYMRKLAKDLSEKDIKQGRRATLAMDFLINGTIGSAIANAVVVDEIYSTRK